MDVAFVFYKSGDWERAEKTVVVQPVFGVDVDTEELINMAIL